MAIQAGTTTLGTRFLDDALEAGQQVFRPRATEHVELPAEFVDMLELIGPTLERTETTVTVTAGSRWQNPAEPADTNADAELTPLDALLGINALTSRGAAPLADHDLTTNGGPIYLDTNGDGQHSPVDVLLTINQLPVSAPFALAGGRPSPLSTIQNHTPQLPTWGFPVNFAAAYRPTAPSSRPTLNWNHGMFELEKESQVSGRHRLLEEIFAGEG